LLTDEETDEFLDELKKAQSKVYNREKSVMQVLQKVEKDMDFLGVTGVEDRL
jgi:phospholipid-translocating ATPase